MTWWPLTLPETINVMLLLATIVAIIYGPIKAVEITRAKDIQRDAEARKRQILASLMRTRRISMHPEHVGALNQIQLEFHDYPQVINAYRNYIANLSEPVPNPGNALDNFLTRRIDLFFDLLHELSKASNLNLDRYDLDRLSYVPVGWATDEDEIRAFRRSLIEVLQGRKPIHIASPPNTTIGTNPFPPPP